MFEGVVPPVCTVEPISFEPGLTPNARKRVVPNIVVSQPTYIALFNLVSFPFEDSNKPKLLDRLLLGYPSGDRLRVYWSYHGNYYVQKLYKIEMAWSAV